MASLYGGFFAAVGAGGGYLAAGTITAATIGGIGLGIIGLLAGYKVTSCCLGRRGEEEILSLNLSSPDLEVGCVANEYY